MLILTYKSKDNQKFVFETMENDIEKAKTNSYEKIKELNYEHHQYKLESISEKKDEE